MTTQSPPSLPPPVPGTERMLLGMKHTLQRVAQRASDDFSRSALAAVDVVIGELLSRERSEFHSHYYTELRRLAFEGLSLLGDQASGHRGEVAEALRATPEQLDAVEGFSRVYSRINGLMRSVVALVEALQSDHSVGTAKFLAAVTEKERDLVARGQAYAASLTAHEAKAGTRVLTREEFDAYLRRRFPERPGLSVAGFRELTGGYQKTTILIDIEDDSGKKESIVVRAEKDDRFVTLDAGDIRSEFQIVRLAHAAGVPVAEPLWLEPESETLGQRFFVSRRVLGQNLGTAVAASETLSSDVVFDFVKTLAKIHATPIDRALQNSPIGRWLQYPKMPANTRANIAYWMDQPWIVHANPSPILARLRGWLEANVPSGDDAPCFIHGDYGLHNVLVDEGKVSGVLDWEAARVGDPAEDLSWFLQSSGGKIDSVQTLRWYHELTGRRMSEFSLRYYDVFNSMKILVGAACAAGMHEATPDAAIEWCNIPFIWAPLFASGVNAKIAAAEAARN